MAQVEGLSSEKVFLLRKDYGLNELPSKKSASVLKLFFSQLLSMLSILLIIASVLSFLIGDKLDGTLILFILLLNALLGFWQEYKVSKELEALRKLEVSESRVIRGGVEIKISSKELLPGDLIILESGDKVPADACLVEASNVSVNESSLTGESLPVVKSLDTLEEKLIFFGTTLISGKAKAVVTQIGVTTRFGQLALKLAEVPEEPTPLEATISSLAKKIGIFSIAIAVLIFLIRYLQGFRGTEVLFTSIAVMVAAVPEGLPTVITISLALGVRRMYKKKTLVRKMSAVESLGATTLICSDKTGTLTQNKMSVKQVIGLPINKKELLKTAVLCNSASLILKENPPAGRAGHGSFDILGDQMEGALLVWANENGVNVENLRLTEKVLEEMPFDFKKRMMSVLVKDGSSLAIYSKGAPEAIIPLCHLSESEELKLNKEYEKLAKKGFRVLAFAKKTTKLEKLDEKSLKGLKFLGILAVADALREEAFLTVQKAKKAGVKIVMVTGDNELTAKTIAEEVGLLEEGDEVMTGAQLSELSDAMLDIHIRKAKVFARVFPEQKLRIIEAYQRLGEIVAVTGDGVNDALALKQAQVGVAMGGTGTDVAKEASDIVILDDNLETLVTAIEQGRLVHNNILKTVKFLLTGNLSEVLVILAAVLLGLPTPLLPAQILWINFVTDGFPALALTADSASKNLMKTSPKVINNSLLNKLSLNFILGNGFLIAFITLGIFWLFLDKFGLEIARSYAFSLLVALQMILIFVMRRHHSVFSNKYLFLAVSFVLVMQGLILYFPPLQEVFKTNSGL